jgi:hypothetical protein
MLFSLEVLKARQGDCLLLHFGSKDEPGLVLIDGGPNKVYKPFLQPRLKEIKKYRQLTDLQPLPVDLLMVSHVDGDHIQGILDLMKEETTAYGSHLPTLLNITGLWHNSFDDIIGHTSDDLTAVMKHQFGPAAVSGGGELPDEARRQVEEACSSPPEAVASSLKVLASIGDGIHLINDAKKLSIARNPYFGGKLIQASQGGKPKLIAKGLQFTVAGPMAPELEALHKEHLKWLEEHKDKPITQALAAYVDTTPSNLSSIVVLAEFGGKHMLLTGDARGDKILQGLQLTGRLGPGQDSTITVDLLKVPHHGSARNLAGDFFKRIIARHYVFSANGKDGNPDRETMEMLWNARGATDYTIHLTYEIAEIDQERKNETTGWSQEKDSLEAFFKVHNIKVDPDPVEVGKPYVSIVKDGQPHIIDLLEDKVGF